MKGKQRSKLEKPAPVIVEVLPASREEKLQYFLQKVESKVVDLIDNSTLTVAKKKIPFSLPDRNEAQILSKQLEKVQQGKLLAHSQLKSVTQQELTLRFQRRLLQPSNTHRPKSQLTNDDISILTKLKKQYRDFEKGLQEKTKVYEDFLEMTKKQKAQLQEQKRKEECQNKKKQIAARLEILEKQKMERQKQFQEQRRQLTEVRARKKLHQQWQNGQKQRERVQMQEKVAVMTSRLKQKTLDMQAIKEHEQKYEQLLAQQKTDREKRRQEYGQKSRQRREDSFEKSKYYTIVLQQDRKRKQDEEVKKKQRLQFLQAAKLYAEQAQRDHSPRLKTHSSEQQKTIDKRQGLSFHEIRQRGNGYMEQAKMAIRQDKHGINTKSLKEKIDKKSAKQSEFQRNSKTRYKDYLSERRMLRPKEEQDMRQTEDKIKDRLIRRNLEDVYKIMGSKGQKGEKLQRVKNIAQRLQVNGKGEEHLMIDKISAKLKILQTLSDCN